MIKLRSVALLLPSVLAISLSACHSRDREELHKFAGDLNKATADIQAPTDTGVLTLTIDAYEGAIALLPAHGTADALKLPEDLTRDLNSAAAVSESGHLFLIKSGHIAAEERLDPALLITPGYGRGSTVRFKLGRAKIKGGPIQIAVL